jgi:TDG/mug DNA glycosylase family protein
VPLALADLHRALDVGAPAAFVMFSGDAELATLPGDSFANGARRFSLWPPELLDAVLEGAGFAERATLLPPPGASGARAFDIVVTATRDRTLPDTVGPRMRVLMCGLNPSLYAADVGVGFARPGNRFWPAAREAGLVSRDRDPWHALRAHGVGMTDLVKRATARADELTRAEFVHGMARVERLVRWLAPAVVCFVGLTGWRAAVDARASAGPQPTRLAGRPVYVMPSTSGANAHATPATLTEHFRAVRALADGHGSPSAAGPGP